MGCLMRPKKVKLPETDSIRELAEFFDSHDMTDFEGELEEITEPVFVRCSFPENFEKTSRGYAIVCKMDIGALRADFGDPYNNAYLEIRRVLQRHGFAWQQGSVYFGGEGVTAVTCVLAAMDLARSLPWFAASVRDIRMLRIEELNDLMPAVHQGSGQ
jgi:virulence-associated protein VapD